MDLAQGRVNNQSPEREIDIPMAKLKEYKPDSDYAEKKINDIQVIKVEITELDKRQLKSTASLYGKTSQRLGGQIIRDFLRKS